MFRGGRKATVDGKGRLNIPVEFKKILDEEYGPDCYVTSLDGKSALIYPFPEWHKIEEKLAALPSMNKAKQKYLDRTNHWGQMARLDGQGRVLIPAQLRESAQMRGEVYVMGKLDHLRVWNTERFDEYLEANPFNDGDWEELSKAGI